MTPFEVVCKLDNGSTGDVVLLRNYSVNRSSSVVSDSAILDCSTGCVQMGLFRNFNVKVVR